MPVIIEPTKAPRFQMGGGDSRRLIGPEMGGRSVSMNFSVFQPGHEFPQHIHDASADVFVVLEGGVSVRQGDSYRPIREGDLAYVPASEVHGTVNQTHAVATLISFQAPPDDALYRGERDSSRSGAAPKPPAGHVSKVRIGNLTSGAPSANSGVRVWTPVGAAGDTEMRVSYYELDPEAALEVTAGKVEEILFVHKGAATLESEREGTALPRWTGVLLAPGETCRLRNTGNEPARIIGCHARGCG